MRTEGDRPASTQGMTHRSTAAPGRIESRLTPFGEGAGSSWPPERRFLRREEVAQKMQVGRRAPRAVNGGKRDGWRHRHRGSF